MKILSAVLNFLPFLKTTFQIQIRNTFTWDIRSKVFLVSFVIFPYDLLFGKPPHYLPDKRIFIDKFFINPKKREFILLPTYEKTKVCHIFKMSGQIGLANFRDIFNLTDTHLLLVQEVQYS